MTGWLQRAGTAGSSQPEFESDHSHCTLAFLSSQHQSRSAAQTGEMDSRSLLRMLNLVTLSGSVVLLRRSLEFWGQTK
jgi:hypothetical protein